MTMIEVVGREGVHEMLADYMDPKLSKRAQVATKAGAEVLRAPLKAEARKVSQRMARAVSVRQAKRNRPATVVGSRRKVAFFWPFVVGGTRAHGPRKAKLLVFVTKDATVRTSHVRGVKANPIVARVANFHQNRVWDAIYRSFVASEST